MTLPVEMLDYVAREDGNFRWQVRRDERKEGVRILDLTLVSQVWQGLVWDHHLQLLVPDGAEAEPTGLLYVTGYESSEESLIFLAQSAGLPCAFLYSIPNQPLFDDLYEDALIAFTFDRYLETGDADWPLLFPMVKSAVRAMDALQALATRNGLALERFVVAGASKRGWTSWLTAVADPRVVAIIPMVYDNLNIPAQLPHQVQMWGDFSEMIGDYTARDLPAKMATERGQQLTRMVDPFTYRERLALPKLIINGANDPYWATDALNLYWHDLDGPKWVLNIPNAGHGLEDLDRLYATVTAFLKTVAADRAFPTLSWSFAENASSVRLQVEAPAVEVRAWIAHAPTPDFRPAPWKATALHPEPAAPQFARAFSRPTQGYMALYGEARFATDAGEFTLSTQPQIVGAQEEG